LNIEEAIIKFVTRELLNSSLEVEADDNLLSDGMVDSMGMLRLVSYIEELMQLTIPHEDLVIENFRTIKAIVKYLEQREVE
jgi:acyl carrier protein